MRHSAPEPHGDHHGATTTGVARRAPLVVHGQNTACRVQQWSFRPDIAQIVLYHQRPLPSAADFASWHHELRSHGYARLRTSAVASDSWRQLDGLGMSPVQELVLLEHDDPASVLRRRPRRAAALRLRSPLSRPIRPLRPVHRVAASLVDQRAFEPGWAIDDVAIADVCSATPHHRARWMTIDGRQQMSGYAVTGRDGTQGFLQRLAVDPACQRHGAGRALVLDSLQWLARRRVRRVLVNTPAHNHPALELYRRTGFRTISERLRVYEQVLT